MSITSQQESRSTGTVPMQVRELGMLSLHFRTVGKRWTLDYLVYDTMG